MVAATFFTPVVDSMEECFQEGRTGVKNDVEAKQIKTQTQLFGPERAMPYRVSQQQVPRRQPDFVS